MRKVACNGKLKTALDDFAKWKLDGSKVDANGHPIIPRLSAVAIVRVLLPMVAPTLKLGDFTTLKACAKWLGELAGGTSWVKK